MPPARMELQAAMASLTQLSRIDIGINQRNYTSPTHQVKVGVPCPRKGLGDGYGIERRNETNLSSPGKLVSHGAK